MARKQMGGLAKAARRKLRKRAGLVETRRKKEFTYRGYTLDEMKAMTLEEIIELLPARPRRSFMRGIDEERLTFVEKVRANGTEEAVRTHCRELPLAWKKSVELARQLRGKTVDQAREYLEKVIALKQPVPMKKYKRWVAHKAGTGPARYPVKAAKAFLKILESAVANAEFTGKEDPDAMVIRVINAHKGATTKAFRPRAYGRSGPWNQDTVNLEIVLEEVA